MIINGDKMKRDELIVGLFLLIFGIVTTILSLNMDIGTFKAAGTGLFPLILGILLIFLSGIYIIRPIIKNRKIILKKEKSNGKDTEEKKSFFKITDQTRQLIFCLVTIILATLFLNLIGYLLTSLLIMISLLIILGMKKWYMIIIISSLTAIGSYLLFIKLLNITLPRGFIGF